MFPKPGIFKTPDIGIPALDIQNIGLDKNQCLYVRYKEIFILITQYEIDLPFV